MNKTGVHYTPEYIADFVVKKISGLLNNKKTQILEPCVGEGVFIKSIHSNLDTTIKPTIDAVEINKDTCKNTRKKYDTKLLARISNTDFLKYKTKKRYDLIIGNPPYVNKRYMTAVQVEMCASLSLEVFGKSLKTPLINLWAAFIIKSCMILSDDGIIAFVLPSDLAHVKHAEPIKKYLLKHFFRIELYEFNNLVFDDAEQHTMLMIAMKSHKNLNSGLHYSNVLSKGNEIKEKKIRLLNNLVPNKWTNHGLNNIEINLLKSLFDELYPVSEYCNSSAGIVTAANNYFILNDEELDEYGLRQYAIPILQKAAYVNGSVTFGKSHWNSLKESNSPCYLLDFSKELTASPEAIKYLSLGVKNKINKRYKCKERDKWYKVPNISVSEGFFFKRCHLYPKMIANDAEICVTDTAYSITMRENYKINSLIYSFYNSLSLVFSEILGRKYAGGVLELTPSEFKSIPLPYVELGRSDFFKFKKNFSNKNNISELFAINDNEILHDGLGVSKKDIKKIHHIYKKLVSNRLL